MKRAVNVTLLFATLGGLATSVTTMVQTMDGSELAIAIVGAVGAAVAALFVDRDGDGVPPLFDEDQR